MWLDHMKPAQLTTSGDSTSTLSKALVENARSFLQNSASAQGLNPNTTTSTQQQIQQNQSPQNLLIQGGTVLVGGAALGAVFVELLKKFGTTAIDSRQTRLTQDLQAARAEKEFYLQEAGRDSKTINDTLHLFITKHLDNTTQYQDLYYLLVEEVKGLRAELKKRDEEDIQRTDEIRLVKSTLKDILSILNMKSRQNQQE